MAEKVKKGYRLFELRLLRMWSAAIGLLLSLAGVTGCDVLDEKTPSRVMYGTIPMALVKVHGTVVSTGNSQPVQGIEVRTEFGYTVVTGSDGKYQLDLYVDPVDGTYPVTFSDVDGALNGEFINEAHHLTVTEDEFTGDMETERELDITLDTKVVSE